jgi:hypothetical protein
MKDEIGPLNPLAKTPASHCLTVRHAIIHLHYAILPPDLDVKNESD